MTAGQTSGSVGSIFKKGTSIVEAIVDNSLGYATGPERALMSALLFDGVQSYMNHICSTESADRSKNREAYLWVHNRDNDYVFSFENVCEALGIDPEYLRLGIANACNSLSFEWKRSRRNF